MHKISNVLNKLPKSQHEKARTMLKEIYTSANEKDARTAADAFSSVYLVKYSKATDCLTKDLDTLLNFYQYPAEHWVHLRTTNPIESTFATVRHRTKKSKNCFSRQTILASVYKLLMEAQKRWRQLNGQKRIAQVVNLEKFIDGIHEKEVNEQLETKQNVAA